MVCIGISWSQDNKVTCICVYRSVLFCFCKSWVLMVRLFWMVYATLFSVVLPEEKYEFFHIVNIFLIIMKLSMQHARVPFCCFSMLLNLSASVMGTTRPGLQCKGQNVSTCLMLQPFIGGASSFFLYIKMSQTMASVKQSNVWGFLGPHLTRGTDWILGPAHFKLYHHYLGWNCERIHVLYSFSVNVTLAGPIAALPS